MKTPYRLVESFAAAVELFDSSATLFVDTETVKLYGKTRLAQFYQKGWDAVVIVEWPNEFELLCSLENYHTVFHNAHYDLTVFQQNSGYHKAPSNFDCTFLLSRIHFCDKENFSLDDVMTYVLGFDPYARQNLNKKGLQSSDWTRRILSEDQLAYAATDVYYLPFVWEAVAACAEDISYKLDMYTLKYCLEFQWHGLPLDVKRLQKRYAANEKEIAEINLPINANSYQQVRKYLDTNNSNDLGLAYLELSGDEKAKAVRRVRKLRKQNSFMDKFLAAGERIYGKFKPSARSGRLTSDDQNLQQLPRALKELFGLSPDQGRVLLYADYSQLELRTACAITSCNLMAELFRKGVDLHTYTAHFLFGVVEDAAKAKKNRQVAKGFNFLALYGGGIPMLISVLVKQMMILLSEQEASSIRNKWRKLWKEIDGWQQHGISMWQKGRLGKTPLGRKYKAKMMTDQLNIENQGAGAEVAKLAMHYFMKDSYNKYPEAWNVLICNFVHDSYILEAPDDSAIYSVIAEDLAKAMQKAWFEMSKCFKIKDLPMPVSVAVGYNWGDIEDEDLDNLYDYTLDPMAMYEVVQ